MKLLLLLVGLFPIMLSSQDANPLVFIYDASGSMWEKIEGEFKYEIAREVLTETVKSMPDSQKIGLVAYGHRRKGDCEDVEFLTDYHSQGKSELIQAVEAISPIGKTPLAKSMTAVLNELSEQNEAATVILLTDGIESCSGDLCEVVRLAKENGTEFILHIIGFDIKTLDQEALRCAAEQSGGQYFEAKDRASLQSVLENAGDIRVDGPAANVSIYTTLNNEPADALVEFYNTDFTNKLGAVRTYGDTAFFYAEIDKISLLVKPLMNSDVSPLRLHGVELNEETMTHRNISLEASGLSVMVTNNSEPSDALVIIYDSFSKKEVSRGRTYGKKKAFSLSPGIYDVSFELLKVEGLKKEKLMTHQKLLPETESFLSVDIETSNINVQTLSAGNPTDCIVSFYDPVSNKYIEGGRTYDSKKSNPKSFILTPGEYKMTIKHLSTGEVKEMLLKLEPRVDILKTISFD